MTTHLITGGSGFIGYALTMRLLNDPGAVVVHYDAFKHYIPLQESRWFANQELRFGTWRKFEDRVTTVRGDVNDRGLLRQTIDQYRPDTITHLAAVPIAWVCNEFPGEAIQNVFQSTCVLLDVIREVADRPRRLVYVSSSMVYGDFRRDVRNRVIPAEETQDCFPVGVYGAMKLSSENAVRAYGRQFGIEYSIVRPSAVYGPTDSNGRVTELFLHNALEGRPLVLDNGGHHQLDFTYVDDIAEGLRLTLNSDKAIGETFNLTRGEGRSIAELADVVADLIPGTEIQTIETHVYRPNRGALKVDKARDLLGYEPRYSLEDGMTNYLNFLTSEPG